MVTTRHLYKQELARCREHFEQIDLQKERGYLMKFTTFSANIENLMPSIPRKKHSALFRQLLLNQVFTTFDQRCLTSGDLVKFRGDEGVFDKEKGNKIYCTYHLGSYRLLTSVLFRKGVDCVLLVGSNMSQSQGGDMMEHVEALRQKHNLTNVFRIVEAGSPTAGLTVLRELKAGRSLIVYVDGSAETAPEDGEEEQFISVRLGNRRVLTRKGVGYLSHATGVPIIPIVSYRQPDLTNVLHSLNAIRPIAHSDREMYCREAMQQLYDSFWPYLNRYPEQWEGWNYIHSFLEPELPKHSSSKPDLRQLVFNENRYTLCDLEHSPILFDRRLYQTYEITEDLRDLLLNLNVVDSIEDVIGEEMLTELMEMEIVH